MQLLRSSVITLVLLSVFIGVIGRGARAETFKNPPLILTGSTPTNVSQGDFNSDGVPDLAYMDGSGLHILLGNGNGTFRNTQNIFLPSGFGGTINVADVSNDGHADVILGGIGPRAQIGVLLGNGDGTFGSLIISVLPLNLTYYANTGSQAGVADLNGDGVMDVVVSDTANHSVYLLLGNNTGSFSLKTVIPNFNSPTTVRIGDFNGDGKADFLVFGYLGATVTVYLNNGNGTFQAGVDYGGANNGITGLVLADMDGDGHLDMVATTQANTVEILHGNSNGTFLTNSEGGANLSSYAVILGVADLNADGTLDVMISDADGLSVLMGSGSLSYDAPVPYALGAYPNTFALGDFDSDGHLDVALAEVGGIVLLRGTAQGTFQSFDVYSVGQTVNAIASADFNRDHIADLALAAGAVGPVLLHGNGDGTFRVQSTTPSSSGSGISVMTGDFDGDGNSDVYLSGTNFAGTVMFGNGNGTFPSQVDLSSIGQIGYQSAVVGDFNGDHRSDVANMNYQSVNIVLGQPNRTFSVSTIGPLYRLQPNVAPAAGDFNQDGNLDLVTGGITTFQVLLGNGDGTFTMGRTMSTQLPGYTNLVAPNTIAAADLDGDGHLDVVIPVSYPSVAEIFYGNGDGTFQYPVVLPVEAGSGHVYIADLNGDHLPDLVFATQGIISIIHNAGNRTFSGEAHYTAGLVKSLAIQDFDGDGFPDIAVASTGSTVAVLLNQPGGSPTAGVLSSQPEPSTLAKPFSMNLNITAMNGASGTPTGTVTFSIDTNPVGTVALAAGKATFTYQSSSLAIGSHSISAVYSGDANFVPAYFTAQHQVIPILYPTTIAVSAQPNPVLAGLTVSLHARVSSPGQVPYGTVSFLDGTTPIGSATLDGNSLAVFDTALLTAGSHRITSKFLGNADFAPVSSVPLTVIVNSFSTSTTLAANPSSVSTGAPVLLTATVRSTNGTPTGSVLFYDGASFLQRAALDSRGVALYGAMLVVPGTHSISTVYSANSAFASSTASPVNVVVLPSGSSAMTSTTLSVAANSQIAEGLILTSSVTASGRPSAGEVVFWDGGDRMGTASLDANGTAIYRSSSLSPGLHYLAASYSGSSTLSPSASQVISHTVPPATPDFTVSSSAVRLLLTGSSKSIEIAVNSINGFQGAVNLFCATTSIQISCSFQPQVVTSGSGISTLTLTMVKPSMETRLKAQFIGWVGALVLCCCSFLHRNKTRARLIFIFAVMCTATMPGCGARVFRGDRGAVETVTVKAECQQSTPPIVHSMDLQFQLRVHH